VERSSGRGRRNTRQQQPHPIGTPERGLSTNTGALSASAWLVDRGITPVDQRWFVELALDVPGQDTQFQLDVYAEEWGFQFRHEGRTSWIRVTDVPFVHGQDEHRLLGRTPRLRDIALFVAQLEREHAVRFDRESPWIHSNIPGAATIVKSWIAIM